MWAAAHGQIAVVEFLLQNVRKKITIDFEFIYSLVCFAPLSLLMVLQAQEFES